MHRNEAKCCERTRRRRQERINERSFLQLCPREDNVNVYLLSLYARTPIDCGTYVPLELRRTLYCLRSFRNKKNYCLLQLRAYNVHIFDEDCILVALARIDCRVPSNLVNAFVPSMKMSGSHCSY
jgi:hypothetical protein